jgi:ribonuclease Z
MPDGLLPCRGMSDDRDYFMKTHLLGRIPAFAFSLAALAAVMIVPSAYGDSLVIDSVGQNGQLGWKDPAGSGTHYAIQWAPTVNGPWNNWQESMTNFTGLGPTGTTTVPMFYRVVTPDPDYKTNAYYSYYYQNLPTFDPLTPLDTNEMRITFMGSMIPLPVRRAQGEMSVFVEMGWIPKTNDYYYHGQALDQFVFDCGAGVSANYAAAVVGFRRMNKVFINHLHGDHMSDLIHMYCFGPSGDRKTPLYVFGQSQSGVESPTNSGIIYDDGVSNFCAMARAACRWHTESFSFQPTVYKNWTPPTRAEWGLPVDPVPVSNDASNDAYAMIPITLPWTNIGGVAYHNLETGVKVTHYPVIHARKGSMGYKLEWKIPNTTNTVTMIYSSDTKPETNSVNQACNNGKGVDVFIHEMVVPPDVWAYKQMGLNSAPLPGDPLYPSYTNTVNQLVSVQNSSHTPQGAYGYILSQINPPPKLAVATHFPVADDTVQSAFASVKSHCTNIVFGRDIAWSFDLMVLRVYPDRVVQCRALVSDYAFNPPVQLLTNGFYAPKYDNGSGNGDPFAQIDPSTEIPATNYDGTVNYRTDGY